MSTNTKHPRASNLTGWKKSSYSGGNDNCVEITTHTPAGAVAVRDSKNPDGPALLFSPSQFEALIQSVRSG